MATGPPAFISRSPFARPSGRNPRAPGAVGRPLTVSTARRETPARVSPGACRRATDHDAGEEVGGLGKVPRDLEQRLLVDRRRPDGADEQQALLEADGLPHRESERVRPARGIPHPDRHAAAPVRRVDRHDHRGHRRDGGELQPAGSQRMPVEGPDLVGADDHRFEGGCLGRQHEHGRPDRDRRRDLDRARPLACELELAHGDALGRLPQLRDGPFADGAPLVVDDDQQHDAGADAARPFERPDDRPHGSPANRRSRRGSGQARSTTSMSRLGDRPGSESDGSSLPLLHDGSRAIGPVGRTRRTGADRSLVAADRRW